MNNRSNSSNKSVVLTPQIKKFDKGYAVLESNKIILYSGGFNHAAPIYTILDLTDKESESVISQELLEAVQNAQQEPVVETPVFGYYHGMPLFTQEA